MSSTSRVQLIHFFSTDNDLSVCGCALDTFHHYQTHTKFNTENFHYTRKVFKWSFVGSSTEVTKKNIFKIVSLFQACHIRWRKYSIFYKWQFLWRWQMIESLISSEPKKTFLNPVLQLCMKIIKVWWVSVTSMKSLCNVQNKWRNMFWKN